MPLGRSQGAQPARGDHGDRVQRRAQRLGQQLDPVQLAHGGERVRAVGALAPARLEQPRLARRAQYAGQQALGNVAAQVEGEQASPADPCPDGLGRLSVAQPFAELQRRDKGQAPRGVSGLAALGVEVGKACIFSEIRRICA